MLLFKSSRQPLRTIAAVLALTFLTLLVSLGPKPALADGAASTRNIVLGAAAAVAGLIIYNNVHHKQVARDTVVGRTRDGGTVYADGRVVYPNGQVLYTSNGNGRVCSYAYGYGEQCGARPVAYYPAARYDRDPDRGRRPGRHKHGEQHDHHGGEGADNRD